MGRPSWGGRLDLTLQDATFSVQLFNKVASARYEGSGVCVLCGPQAELILSGFSVPV